MTCHLLRGIANALFRGGGGGASFILSKCAVEVVSNACGLSASQPTFPLRACLVCAEWKAV